MSHHNGLSAVELLITLAIAALIAAFSIPSFAEWANRYRLEIAAQGMLRSLALARSESTRRNMQVSLYSESGHWEHGWSVYADLDHDGAQSEGEILFRQPPAAGLTIRGNSTIRQLITYGPDGASRLPSGAFQAGSLFFCLHHQNLDSYKIVISRSGRARAERSTNNSGDCPAKDI